MHVHVAGLCASGCLWGVSEAGLWIYTKRADGEYRKRRTIHKKAAHLDEGDGGSNMG